MAMRTLMSRLERIVNLREAINKAAGKEVYLCDILRMSDNESRGFELELFSIMDTLNRDDELMDVFDQDDSEFAEHLLSTLENNSDMFSMIGDFLLDIL